jgi:hypothetical protein
MKFRREIAHALATNDRRRLSYAHVAAALALFFSLSSGALAARHFLITSTKQIKPSVLSAIRGHAGTAGDPGSAGSSGPKGAAGPTGAPGAPGTTSAIPEVLAPEQTESGVWGGTYEIQEGRNRYRLTASFPIPLPQSLLTGSVGYIPKGSPPTADCPGPGQAALGMLCLYETSSKNLRTPTRDDVFDPEKFEEPFAAGRSGFAIELTALAEDPSAVAGTWAVTAPRGVEGREPAARAANGALR